jgi:hypothetical protein
MGVRRRYGRRIVLSTPVRVDPEVAAAKFKEDLLWLGSPRAVQLGLQLVKQEGMYAIVKIPALKKDGGTDDYFVRLGAEYYDKWPPTAIFVQPETWDRAESGTRWLPIIQCQGIDWFALHSPYTGGGGITLPQMLCFTFTAEYYMVSHSPPESSVWRQGHHTLTATLTRLAEVLKQPHYRGPGSS